MPTRKNQNQHKSTSKSTSHKSRSNNKKDEGFLASAKEAVGNTVEKAKDIFE